MKIVHIVNSTYGRPSNIAIRTAQIFSHLKNDFALDVYARGNASNEAVHVVPIFGEIVSRSLNLFRTKFKPSFEHRFWDIRYFEACFFLKYPKFFQNLKSQNGAIHLWEYSEKIIFAARAAQVPLILEIPILPHRFAKSLYDKGLLEGHFPPEYLFETRCLQYNIPLIVPSTFVAEALVEYYHYDSEIINVVPFGADLPPSTTELKSTFSNGMVFGFCGNLNSRKGIPFLIEALDHRDFNGDVLVLCGRNMLGSRPITKHIKLEFPGFINPVDYYEKFDVYVFPSLMEGSSKSVYEAMAYGRPVITTKNSGSVIENGVDGIIVEAGNVEQLRQRLLDLKKSAELRKKLGENARAKIKENFQWQHYAKRVAAVYRKLLS